MITPAISLFVLIRQSNAHSWARCVNYHADITGLDYDEDQCTGWIRGWEFGGVDFGADRGVNHQVGVGSGQNLCQRTLSGTADSAYGYANTDKIAQYTSGETVRVVWPAKNHANYECFGNIPDASMKLYMNPIANPTNDLTNAGGVSMSTAGYRLVKDWQEGCTPGADGCGFQNCPKFCENTDRATCFGDFVVPTVDTEGYYTFVWYWIFNPGSPYISCYEAYVKPSAGGSTGGNTGSTSTTQQPGTTTSTTSTTVNSNGNNNTPKPGTTLSNNDGDDDIKADIPSTITDTVFNPSGGSSSTGNLNGFITMAPLCISHGDDYDQTGLTAFANGRLSAVLNGDDTMDIVNLQSDANSMNFTIQISHSEAGIAITNALDDENHDDSFCDDFEDTYTGTSCGNCDDVITYALYEPTGAKSGADGRGWMFGIGLVLALFVNV